MLHSLNQVSFTDRVLQLIPGADRVQLRRMFGGVGLFEHNTMFAIAVNERLFLKADAKTRGDFERRGLERFHYDHNDQSLTLDFYLAPAEVFRHDRDMALWVNRARAAAFRGKTAANS
ncbi:TfoX/Sxy family protein [Litorivivens sp.]|jgi:DNA transformation protein and related proteins|uniref:TfoX/Sxy family protein n=1 Tax=Litorivivens sp. TaxID=2020868 RepID=UPI000C46510A|nr:transcriptional regulator [Spongiibacteraceae bacterium]